MVKLQASQRRHGSKLFPNLQGEISLLFDQLGIDRSPDQDAFVPALNISEGEGHVEIALDLPGVSPEALQIEFKEGQLAISGERQWRESENAKKRLRTECGYGKFERLIVLGEDVDADHIDATYRDGVLLVTIPKAPRVEAKRIEVQR